MASIESVQSMYIMNSELDFEMESNVASVDSMDSDVDQHFPFNGYQRRPRPFSNVVKHWLDISPVQSHFDVILALKQFTACQPSWDAFLDFG